MEYITKDCKVTLRENGEIAVDYIDRQVTITDNTGTRRASAASIIPGISNNWWTANWSGSHWNLDLDCGAQRFNGVTTTKRVKEALQVAGLNDTEIKSVMRKAKKHTHSFVSRG